MKVSFQRDKEDDPRRTAGQVRDHQKTLGFSASSSSRGVLGDVDMGEVPIPLEEVPVLPPPAEPPRMLRTSSETGAMMLAAIHPYGREGLFEISKTEFESIVGDGFCFEEDTLKDLPTEEEAEGVNRELDLLRSFPVYQATR